MKKDKTELLSTQKQEQYVTFKSSFSIFINVMMGIGPIIIPAVFREAGLIMASVFTIIISFISYLTCEFIVESMSISNALVQNKIYKQQQSELQDSIQASDDVKSEVINNKKNEKNTNDLKQKQGNFVEENDTEEDGYESSRKQKQGENWEQGYFDSFKLPSQKLHIVSDSQTQINRFTMQNKYEYGEMGDMVWGPQANALITLVIAIYLIGILIAKCISTGEIMAETFQSVQILNTYEFWLSLFFLISAIFSFRNVQSTKKLQSFILLVRFTTIFVMIGGCILQIFNFGMQPLYTKEYPLINFKGFESFFSNTVLAFALHHSLPSMLTPVRPEKDIRKVTRLGFMIACITYLFLPILATMAFGTNLIKKGGLKYFNDDFKVSQPIVFYISSFYMFLNITAFPVLTITTRNNLMKLLVPKKVPKQSWRITKYTLLFTLLIVIPIFTIAILVQDIQIVLDIVGGLFGVTLMMILPSIIVIKGRQMLKNEGLDNNFNIHRCTFSQEWIPKLILIVSVLFFFMDIYIISKKDLF